MKRIFKPIIWIVIAMNIIAVVIGVVLQSPQVEYSYEFINGEILKSSWLDVFEIGSYVYMAIIIIMLIVAIINIIIVKKSTEIKLVRNIVVPIVLIPVSVVIILFSKTIVAGVDYDYGAEYFEFSDDEHKVVICEESYLLGGWGTVYQVEEDGTAYMIGEFVTDNGYRNYGEYDLEWLEEGVNIRYRFDESSEYIGVLKARWTD